MIRGAAPRSSNTGPPGSDPDYTDEVSANNESSQASGDIPRRKRAEKTVEITDPKAIRALAHAARIEVISELYATQVSHTATELAARTGLTPSAMSYHLRASRNGGSWHLRKTPVMPANVAGRRLERTSPSREAVLPAPRLPWLTWSLMPSDAGLRPSPSSRGGTPATGGETGEEPAAVVLSSNLLYLTNPQRRELLDRIRAVLREYELEDPNRIPEGAERVATLWSMIPDDRVAPGQ